VPALDLKALARELAAAYASRQMIASPPSARDSGFDLGAAYAVEAELARLRRSAGRTTVGRKVGFANRALWRVLKLDTLLWAHMYDDTVQHAERGAADLSLARMYSPKIEPEIVFKLGKPLAAGQLEPAAVLEAVEWLALGFEVIDCVFPDWKFEPVDFVASFGLHAALVVGEPRRIEAAMIPTLVDELARFTVRLMKNGQLVDEGSGRNVLRSPALCLGELATATARQVQAEPLAAGELISSGTLTMSHPIAPGETWSAVVDGIELTGFTLTVHR
jgi:2-oxo-3-hexenedioate decarboxylase